MPFLVAAVVLLAVLCLLNMMITFAVLRRLRSHEERLAARPAGRSSGVDALVGRELPEFDATSTAGAAVSRSDLLGRARVLGVFSATCEPCHEQARAFAELDDPGRVALVTDVRGREDVLRRFVPDLGDTPTIILEPDSGPLAGELGVSTFPTLLRLDEDGRVVQAGNALSQLASPVHVRA
ncbi:TlpA family protein disulfide reductase [Actinoallomurus acaciae]|uniref:TlpA family protein disulfide reductase n=1 Tax=Actinoallomurus acaciae TaxID=502577 RepID=A0ABV5YRK2_9ACTN